VLISRFVEAIFLTPHSDILLSLHIKKEVLWHGRNF
jgi:hypothetical protein